MVHVILAAVAALLEELKIRFEEALGARRPVAAVAEHPAVAPTPTPPPTTVAPPPRVQPPPTTPQPPAVSPQPVTPPPEVRPRPPPTYTPPIVTQPSPPTPRPPPTTVTPPVRVEPVTPVTPPPPASTPAPAGEWARVEEALRRYGGYAVIFRREPPSDRIAMFQNMLVNINVNTRGMCVYGGGYRWYDELKAWVYDVKATWSPNPMMVAECKRLIRGAIEAAFAGYYDEVREY